MTEQYILGGYTKRHNQGISHVSFDPETRSFGQLELIDQLNQPTFVTFNASKNYLFAINKGAEHSGVVAYKRQAHDQWQRISEVYTTNVPGCHLTFHERTHTLYVANYHEGSIDCYRFEAEQLSFVERIEHVGSSVHPNQQSAHMHFVGTSPDDKALFTCDLGADVVTTFAIDPRDGGLTPLFELKLPAGTGPRHLAFHPNGQYVYIIGELANTIHTAILFPDNRLELIQKVSILPRDLAPERANTAAGAAIRISQDGQYLYTSTRFYNVLTVYKIATNGEIRQIQQLNSHGEIPRDFILSEQENYLLVAHQDSDNIVLFARNSESGLLSFIPQSLTAPECVCITHG